MRENRCVNGHSRWQRSANKKQDENKQNKPKPQHITETKTKEISNTDSTNTSGEHPGSYEG